jgi:hypothetical protein
VHFPLSSLEHLSNLIHGSMNVASFMANSIANIADVLVALVAMRARALAHWVEHDVRATMRTAEGSGVHLLALANKLRRVAKRARLLWREAWAGPMIEHQFTIV